MADRLSPGMAVWVEPGYALGPIGVVQWADGVRVGVVTFNMFSGLAHGSMSVDKVEPLTPAEIAGHSAELFGLCRATGRAGLRVRARSAAP